MIENYLCQIQAFRSFCHLFVWLKVVPAKKKKNGKDDDADGEDNDDEDEAGESADEAGEDEDDNEED